MRAEKIIPPAPLIENNAPISIVNAHILSHMTPTKTKPLGAVPAGDIGTVVNDLAGVDMKKEFSITSSPYDHSRQYFKTYADRGVGEYWDEVLIQFKLKARGAK